jgi:hypothetical protein
MAPRMRGCCGRAATRCSRASALDLDAALPDRQNQTGSSGMTAHCGHGLIVSGMGRAAPTRARAVCALPGAPWPPSRTRSGFRPRWEQDYPAIRAEAAQGGATIYVGDEVASAGVRPAANIISAITPEGKLRSTPSPALDAVRAFRLHRRGVEERRAQPDRESRVRIPNDLRRTAEKRWAASSGSRPRLDILGPSPGAVAAW